MNDKIQLILKTKNISASKFADEIGVQRSSISHILSGRNNPSLDFIQKILKKFPDINSDWLMFDNGSMYKTPDLFSGMEDQKNEKNKQNAVPFHSEEGNIEENEINLENTEVEKVVKEGMPKVLAGKRGQIKKEILPLPVKKTVVNPQEIIAKTVGKKIEKIIILHSDKSFTEYMPE